MSRNPHNDNLEEKERFDQDRKERREFRDVVLNYLSKEKPTAWHSPDQIQEFDKQVKEHLKKGEFNEAFIPLKILKDHYRGIHTEYHPNEGGRHPLLLRDARQQQGKYQCEATYYNYATLGINYLNAIRDLLEIEAARNPSIDLEKVRQELSRHAWKYYVDIIPTDPKHTGHRDNIESLAESVFGEFFHSVILPYYRRHIPELSKEEAIEHLTMARDFCNFNTKSYAIATMGRYAEKFQDKVASEKSIDVAELELPLYKLTDKQRGKYINRANKNWYNKQSRVAQALIDTYANVIIGEGHEKGRVIPTQLISHLIGSRNAYEKVTAVLNHKTITTEETSVKILNSTYHAGSQAHLTNLPNLQKQEALTAQQKATNLSVEQLHLLTGATVLGINTLVSPLDPRREHRESRVTKQIQMAVRHYDESGPQDDSQKSKSPTTVYSNTPINAARRISSANLTGIQHLITLANEILEPKLRYIEIYKQNYGESETIGRPDTELLQLCECVEELKAAIQSESRISPRDNNNVYLTIAAKANQVAHLLNELDPQGPNYVAQVSGCYSGQDRGGLVSSQTTTESILQYLTIDHPKITKADQDQDKQRKAIICTHALNDHTQQMAGGPMTVEGATGIKETSSEAIPDDYPEEAKAYIQRTSRYNEKIPNNPDQNQTEQQRDAITVAAMQKSNSNGHWLSWPSWLKKGKTSTTTQEPSETDDNGLLH